MNRRENIQHSTFNLERAIGRYPWTLDVQCSKLHVPGVQGKEPEPLSPGSCLDYRERDAGSGRWALLLLLLLALPAAAQSPTNALSALAPPYGEIRPAFWEQHGIALLVAGLVLLALAGAAGWMFLRPPAPVVVPPETRAREALAKLQGQPENGQALSEISQVMRHYLAAVFHLPPYEMTTAEFTASLTGNPAIESELARALAGFLHECDQRKFSPVNPAAPLDAAGRALQLVLQIEKQRGESVVKS